MNLVEAQAVNVAEPVTETATEAGPVTALGADRQAMATIEIGTGGANNNNDSDIYDTKAGRKRRWARQKRQRGRQPWLGWPLGRGQAFLLSPASPTPAFALLFISTCGPAVAPIAIARGEVGGPA